MASDEMREAEVESWVEWQPPDDVLKFVSPAGHVAVTDAIRQAHRAGFETAWNRRAAPPCPPEPVQGSIVEAFEALREAGGKAWDAIGDPEAYLRGEPEVERLVAAARRALPALAYAEHNAEEREAYCELSTALAPFERPAGQDHGQLIRMTRDWLAKGYPLEDLCE